jgi:hypothetical protein
MHLNLRWLHLYYSLGLLFSPAGLFLGPCCGFVMMLRSIMCKQPLPWRLAEGHSCVLVAQIIVRLDIQAADKICSVFVATNAPSMSRCRDPCTSCAGFPEALSLSATPSPSERPHQCNPTLSNYRISRGKYVRSPFLPLYKTCSQDQWLA